LASSHNFPIAELPDECNTKRDDDYLMISIGARPWPAVPRRAQNRLA